METKTYFFHPEKKVMKQGFLMEDQNGELVYEAKMLTQPLFGPMEFEFINHITGKTEGHKVGKTVTAEHSNLLGLYTAKSSFKYDDQKIWNYLHDMGIRISTGLARGKIGMRYEVSLEGSFLATVESTAPNGGGSIITGGYWYNVTTEEKDLDLAFLVTFAIARTDQMFYD